MEDKIKIQKLEVDFSWPKPSTDYTWEDCKRCDYFGNILDRDDLMELYPDGHIPDGPFLIEKDFDPSTLNWEPFEHDKNNHNNLALFAQFADLVPTQDAFLQWARKHGKLINYDNRDLLATFVESPNGSRVKRVRADPFSFWEKEQRDLSFITMLWEMLNDKNTGLKKLDEIVRLKRIGKEFWVYKIKREYIEQIDFELIKSERLDYENVKYTRLDYEKGRYECDGGAILLKDYSYGVETVSCDKTELMVTPTDTLSATLSYITDTINSKIVQFPMQVKFMVGKNNQLRKTIVPTSLLSAMWYQLYLAMAGVIKLRRCKICKKWENMEGHRDNWSMHKECASNERVKRLRAMNKTV